MRPLNAISVFQHGFIAPLYSSFDSKKIEELELFYLPKCNHGRIKEWATESFIIRAPLFILTELVNYNIKVLYCKNEEEFFIPTEANIGGSDLETAKAIKRDMEETTSALKINPSAYISDGCARDVSQIMTPVSKYVMFIAEAKSTDWLNFYEKVDKKTLVGQFASVLCSTITLGDDPRGIEYGKDAEFKCFEKECRSKTI